MGDEYARHLRQRPQRLFLLGPLQRRALEGTYNSSEYRLIALAHKRADVPVRAHIHGRLFQLLLLLGVFGVAPRAVWPAQVLPLRCSTSNADDRGEMVVMPLIAADSF